MPFDLKIVSFCIQSKNQKVCLFQTGDLSVTFQFCCLTAELKIVFLVLFQKLKFRKKNFFNLFHFV